MSIKSVGLSSGRAWLTCGGGFSSGNELESSEWGPLPANLVQPVPVELSVTRVAIGT